MSDSVRPHRWQPTRLRHPWDSPDKNTGVGCHFLFQCMKVNSESEVAQSCPTLLDPMDYSLPGSSVHGIFQARVLEWGAIAFSMCYMVGPYYGSWFFFHSLCQSLLLGVSRPFTFRIIIDFVSSSLSFYYLFSINSLLIILLLLTHTLVFVFFFFWCRGLLKHFLEYCFDLFNVFEYITLYYFLIRCSRYYNIHI